MLKLKLPDFVIGGAPRCGTTWLYAIADRHPSIAMAKPVRPEPKFFLVDELYERGLDYYSGRWFADLHADRLLGEKSTNYLESERAARRIHASLPNVKLIFSLRDPVERAWSNYLWSRQNGIERETFAVALSLEADRDRALSRNDRYSRPHAYFSRGLYADLLRPYLELFGRDRILILRLEDIAANPAATAAKFHRFLGVEPHPEHTIGLGPLNAASTAPGIDAHTRASLERLYSEPNQRLAALLGPSFVNWPAKDAAPSRKEGSA